MDLGWFITTYLENVNAKPNPKRWCAMNNYTVQILASGGKWEEVEVGANFAIVKVKTTTAILNTIAQDVLFTKIPGKLLTDSLATLTQAQKTTITNLLNQMGYTAQEVQTGLGNNIANKTIGDVLNFCATRRIPPRFDPIAKKIVFDKPSAPCTNNVSGVDGRVK